MAEWWEAAPLATPSQGGQVTVAGEKPWWEEAKPAAQPIIPSADPAQGNIFPYRQPDKAGEAPKFDYGAGVLGSLLRTITTPGDILWGNVPTPYGGTPVFGGMPAAPTGANANAPDAISRAAESAWNISPMSPAYRAGSRFGAPAPLADDAWLPGMRGNLTKPPMTPPSARDIKGAAGTGYNSVRESGYETPSGPLGGLAGDIRNSYGERFSPENAKSTFSRLDMMQNPKRSATSIADLMAHRDDLTAIIGKGGPDGLAAREARDAVDKFIGNLSSGNTSLSGYGPPAMAPEKIGPTLETARGNTRSVMAVNKISGELDPAATGFIERAEGHAGPGRRAVAMQLGDRAEAILKNNKEIGGFSPDEVKALELIRDGNATRNTLEWFGRRFGGTDLASTAANLSIGGGVGYGAGGKWGLLAAGAMQGGGLIAKAAANAIARGQTRVAEELVRRNSPLAQSLVDAAHVGYTPHTGRDMAIMNILSPGLLAEPERRLPPGYI